jgi:hypothetical protein
MHRESEGNAAPSYAQILTPISDAPPPSNDPGQADLARFSGDQAFFLQQFELCALRAVEYAEERLAKLEKTIMRQRIRLAKR